MKANQRFYIITRQIHLYASLITLVFLLMYVLTSYMFIYHDIFKVDIESESMAKVVVTPAELQDSNWENFLKMHNIRGRLIWENQKANGDLVKLYETAKSSCKITLFNDRNQVEIVSQKLNLSGKITELHRLRGYGGSFIYSLYAVLLDVVGISLILFAITGVILWLKLLKHNTIAWIILISGFIYVSAVIGYLMLG